VVARDARAEAAARVGHQWDVRVLEPSPPAVTEPPYAADDPTAGGEVVPVDRVGSRSWADVSAHDPDLRAWCEDRWLVRHPLQPVPDTFAATRKALHAVAEHTLAPARQAATGKIGLRFTYHGFGTPFFGDDRQLRVEDGVLVDGDARLPLDIDPVAARALGDWFGLCASLLEQLRADADADGAGAGSRVQLWPEHFDMAVVLGTEGHRANYGGSPGDDDHAQPYLYVGPWERHGASDDPFWNEPFGASLSSSAIREGADPLAFFRRAQALLT
jgi:hypothetical protein